MDISFKARTGLLTAFTALMVAYTRHALLTSWAPWDSFGSLVSWWIIHYFAMLGLLFLVIMVTSQTSKFFTGETIDPMKQLSVFEFRTMITVLTASLAILALKWFPSGFFNTGE